MKKNKEIGLAQQISQQQIDAANAQKAQMVALLQQALSSREAGLAPIMGQLSPALQAMIRSSQEIMGKGMDFGAGDEFSIPELPETAGTREISEGLSGEARGALTGEALNAPSRFADQAQAIRLALMRRGGGLPMSGMAERALIPLSIAGEQERASRLRDVTLTGEQARRADVGTNVGIREANRQAAMNQAIQRLQMMLANKNLGLNARNLGLNMFNTGLSGLTNAIRGGTDLAGTIGNIYSPNAYVGGAGTALNAAGAATNTRANLVPRGGGFWSSFFGAALPIASNIIAGRSAGNPGGGGYGPAGPPPGLEGYG